MTTPVLNQPPPTGLPMREFAPPGGWRVIDLHELWRYRELLWFLALRDIQVRYKQTALGALWAVLQPLGMMVVLEIVLTRFLGQPADPVARYAKLLPWTFFAGGVVAATNSLITNADMLRKIYFPRLLMPLAAIGSPLVDLAIAFVVLLGMMVIAGIGLSWRICLLPLTVLTTILATLGIGVLAAGLCVTYRDFRYVVPFLVSVGFFMSGVMYDIDTMHWAMNLNPMAGSIAAFRAAVLGVPVDWSGWAISSSTAAIGLIIGLAHFGASQRRFADVI